MKQYKSEAGKNVTMWGIRETENHAVGLTFNTSNGDSFNVPVEDILQELGRVGSLTVVVPAPVPQAPVITFVPKAF